MYRFHRKLLGLYSESDVEVQCRLTILNAHLDWLYGLGVNVNTCWRLVVPELFR